MKSRIGKRAVVVGAGMAGLSAAGALADHFEQVIILELDALTPVADTRSGVPQGQHFHFLLAGGLKALEEIVPGYTRELVEAGAISAMIARDMRYERAGLGVLPQRDFGFSLMSASRPLIELVL